MHFKLTNSFNRTLSSSAHYINQLKLEKVDEQVDLFCKFMLNMVFFLVHLLLPALEHSRVEMTIIF